MNADSHNGLASGAEILRYARISVFISVYPWTTDGEKRASCAIKCDRWVALPRCGSLPQAQEAAVKGFALAVQIL
jgi:hypothetical protein